MRQSCICGSTSDKLKVELTPDLLTSRCLRFSTFTRYWRTRVFENCGAPTWTDLWRRNYRHVPKFAELSSTHAISHFLPPPSTLCYNATSQYTRNKFHTWKNPRRKPARGQARHGSPVSCIPKGQVATLRINILQHLHHPS